MATQPGASGQRTSTLRRAGLEPWIWILLITGAFQIYRGAPVDGLIFLAVGVLLTRQMNGSARGDWPRAEALRDRLREPVARGLAVALAAVFTVSKRYGRVDTVVVGALGVVVIVLAWPNVDAASRSVIQAGPLRNSAIAWSVLGVAAALWELTEYFLGHPSAAATRAHPALSDLVDPLLHLPAGRAVFSVAWLGGLVFLLDRGRQR